LKKEKKKWCNGLKLATT